MKTFVVIMERIIYSTVIIKAESHEKASQLLNDFDFDNGFIEENDIDINKFEQIQADLVSDYDDMIPIIKQKKGE